MDELNERSSVSTPSIKTYISEFMTPFPIPAENNISLDTEKFLTASQNVVSLMETIGKTFSHNIDDMKGNISQLRQKYEEHTELFTHVEYMISSEKIEGHVGQATESLLWLTRHLNFFLKIFKNFIIDNDEVFCETVTKAYDETLANYHGWLAKQLFKILLQYCPSKQELHYKLALKNTDALNQVTEDLTVYLENLEQCIEHVRNVVKQYFETVEV